MKYTKEQLQGMSDLEVNRALAMVMDKYAGVVGEWMPNGVKVNDDSGFFYSECDYCNNWNDVMPLAVEHRISLCPAEDRDDCEWYGDKIFSDNIESCWSDVSPQRAIACCLILVLQEGSKE